MVTIEEWRKQIVHCLNSHAESLERKQAQIDSLSNSMWKLESKINVLMRPVVKKRILEVLSNEEKPRTKGYIERRVPDFHYIAFRELRDDGKLVASYSGTQILYSVNTEEV